MIDLSPFRPAERAALRPPEDLTVSEWAARYRIIEAGAEPGRWNRDRLPYLNGIMDAASDPGIRKITIRKSVQSGGTEAAKNIVAYLIDQNPTDVIWAVPRREDIPHFQFRRFAPMVDATPKLREHTTGRRQDEKKKEFVFDRCAVYFRAATSKADLASDPCGAVVGDELDKWTRWTEDEGDPVRLLEDRTTTFWDSLVVLISTPSTVYGHIERHYQASDRRSYWVPCPRCGTFQVLTLDGIRVPEGMRDPEAIRNDRLAWYECRICEERIEDQSHVRAEMIEAGVWVQDGARIDKAGRVKGARESEHAGFHISMLMAPWKTWSEIVARFFEIRHDPPQLQVYVNQWLGEPFQEKAHETTVEQLQRHVLNYPAGEVPAGAVVLVAGVDVQEDHFWVAVRAFGWDLESWGIWFGRLETWTAVWDVLRRPWASAEGADMFVRLANIDSGFRTWEVYEETAIHRDIARPIKGDNKTTGLPYATNRIGRNPKTGETIKGHVRWTINTQLFKDRLAALQRKDPGDPGGWWIHEDPTLDYLQQLSAEHKTITRDKKTGRATFLWKPKYAGKPNHALDVEVYALAAAHMLEVWTLRSDVPQKPARPRRRRRRKAGGWFEGLR